MTIVPFFPARKDIAGITRSNPAIVTTTTPHGYLSGIIVRLFLPGDFGMNSLNEGIFTTEIIDALNFAINTDTRNLDPFTLAATTTQKPQVLPIAEDTDTLANATINPLPGP